jgi:act minimal PKS chain-length factor (CLF/KS beta)
MSGAVVTGIGVVAPNGLGVDAYWSATLEGRSGLDAITRFDASAYPVRLAGEVRDFDSAQHIPSRLLAQSDRGTQMAIAAADWALADAGVDPAQLPEFEMSVITANASGGYEFIQRELQALWRNGPRHVSAYMSFAWFYGANAGQVSIRHGMRGASRVVASEQAGGLDAVADARRALRNGSRLALAGGIDASLCPWGLVTQMASGRLSARPQRARAYVPFDAEACGYIPGEGGALLTLERSDDDARRRGRRAYGELAGYGATFDPAPGTTRRPGLRRAAERALADAGAAPEEVDVVFADAVALPELDREEARAITDLFGPFGVPVTAPKALTGRLSCGGGALDIAAALLCMRDGLIPPTPGVDSLAPGVDIDLVRGEPLAGRICCALVLARGYGGFNSAVVIRKPPKEEDQT